MENGQYYVFYCSPDNTQQWDAIRMVPSADASTWSNPEIVLSGGNPYDYNSVCDPSVVKFHGVYYLYHTCINTVSPPDGYKNNRICVATADSITGPYHLLVEPVVQNITCAPTNTNIYCVGQPSALVHNDTVYLYFTQVADGVNYPGPNQGYVYLATSTDGIHFEWANAKQPVYLQRDVDVKYDRTSQVFLMVQGDVGDKHISYAMSKDGVHFTPYNLNNTIATNPNLPSGGTNNNPGLASESDGTFSGMTITAYGSSYTAGWGDWHLYASYILVDPNANDCTACAYMSCDFQCEKVLGSPQWGFCAHPHSKNGQACCDCTAIPAVPDCHVCAPEGCVAGCVGAGYQMGICGSPGSSNPSACCSCFN
eukprot:TRINITY_DN12246_c0_g1_i1.p1 TRINITY_DN12246_c0_g1~~TRINITY_DN12246_c0_g1_i1.p1  ORF type:complete len:411 (-),score=56.46 TRINITY_DN12246_c0_g1_i1:31-1131(-)